MSYEIEGRLLEVCTCNVLCPCWVGEDPDYKTCDTTIAWGIEKGTIEGVDVGGLTIAVSAHIPKNILEPEVVEGRRLRRRPATDEQQGVLLRLFTGQLGGAVADLAGLIGEVVAVERAPITFTVEGGKGRLTIGTLVEAEMAPFIGATGNPTTLAETVFSTIPGSPVYASKASHVHARRQQPRHPERRPPGPQRAPGPLPLRGLTTGRGPTDVHARAPPRRRAATGRSSPGRSSRSRRSPGSPLWLWAARRTGRYLHHEGGVGAAARRGGACSPSAGSLMIVAMMLPSQHPARHHLRRRSSGRRRGPARSSCCCSLGYLVVWAGFGVRGLDARSGDPRRRRRPAVAGRASPADPRSDAARRRACGSSARSATGASTSAGARSGSSSTAGAARPSGARRSRWASPMARSASAAAGR